MIGTYIHFSALIATCKFSHVNNKFWVMMSCKLTDVTKLMSEKYHSVRDMLSQYRTGIHEESPYIPSNFAMSLQLL